MQRALEVEGPYDFRATLQIHQLGSHDPTVRFGPGTIVKALDGPAGPVTLSAEWRPPRVLVSLEGPGASWLEPRLPAFFGLHDRPWAPPAGPLHALWLAHRGLRLARAPTLLERHAGFVLQQRVTFGEAARAWRVVHEREGASAPGAAELRVPLDAERWRRVSAADAGRLGLDLKRWTALQEAARASHHVARAEDDHAALRVVLDAIPGTGPWTRECVLGFARGDADALPLGDVHFAPTVTRFFDGRPQASDARMVELLEPLRPHRFRVLRWLVQPRYGPLASGARTR
ncbi:MAG: hypothetical protein IT385_22715 [Deltaproteobacteria bacterium]|nr:hypothetical protein [Deltaproteobacteria bacterium]